MCISSVLNQCKVRACTRARVLARPHAVLVGRTLPHLGDFSWSEWGMSSGWQSESSLGPLGDSLIYRDLRYISVSECMLGFYFLGLKE